MSVNLHKLSDSNKPLWGFSLALLATLLWSGNFVVARGLADVIPPISLAFWRWAIATITVLPFAIVPAWKHRVELRQHLPYLMLCALIGVSLFNTLIYVAGHTTEAFNMSLIAISSPVFMLFLSRLFLKEPLRPTRLVGTGITVMGVLLLISEGNPMRLVNLQFAVGDLWMLAAAFTFASYSLLLRFKPATLPPVVFLFVTFALGLALLFPAYLWESSRSAAVVWQANTDFVVGVCWGDGFGRGVLLLESGDSRHWCCQCRADLLPFASVCGYCCQRFVG